MTPKALIALTAAAAIAVGFALPAPDKAEAEPASQVQMLELE